MLRLMSFMAVICFASFTYSGDYSFNPEDLQNIANQAGTDVDEYLRLYPPSELQMRNMSENFFHRVDSEEDLRHAFRTELVLERTHQLLRQKYPALILPQSRWVWNNVGGVYARIKVLHCSPWEYIALWGTSLPQHGFSGEYSYMKVYDIMLTGEMESNNASVDGAPPRLYTPGKTSLLEAGETRYYNLNSYTYMMDYGRGNISMAFYQGVVAPWLFANHDLDSLKGQMFSCGQSFMQGAWEGMKNEYHRMYEYFTGTTTK